MKAADIDIHMGKHQTSSIDTSKIKTNFEYYIHATFDKLALILYILIRHTFKRINDELLCVPTDAYLIKFNYTNKNNN